MFLKAFLTILSIKENTKIIAALAFPRVALTALGTKAIGTIPLFLIKQVQLGKLNEMLKFIY